MWTIITKDNVVENEKYIKMIITKDYIDRDSIDHILSKQKRTELWFNDYPGCFIFLFFKWHDDDIIEQIIWGVEWNLPHDELIPALLEPYDIILHDNPNRKIRYPRMIPNVCVMVQDDTKVSVLNLEANMLVNQPYKSKGIIFSRNEHHIFYELEGD